MLNSVAHGRQQARKVLVVQLATVLASALLLWLASPAHALAAALGGGALVLGSGLTAWLVLSGQSPAAAGLALGRLLAGMVFKWLVLILALVLGAAVWKLPPIGLAAGVAAALVAQVVAQFVTLKRH